MVVHFTMKRYALLAARGGRILAQSIGEYRNVEGVTLVRLDVLMAVQFGPVLQRDLSIAFCVCPSVMSRIVSALEKHGYVVRTKMPGDRRQRIVEITPRGRWVVDPLYDGVLAEVEGISLQYAVEDQLQMDWGHVFDEHHVAQAPIDLTHNAADLVFAIGPTLRRLHPDDYFDGPYPPKPLVPVVPADSADLSRMMQCGKTAAPPCVRLT